MCARPGSTRSRTFRGPSTSRWGELADCVVELDAEDEIIVCRHHGARSYEGAQILIESGFPRVANLIGGIDLWSCLVDPSIPRYREGG